MRKIWLVGIVLFALFSCKEESKELEEFVEVNEEAPEIIEEFGYVLNNYLVIKDKLKNT